MKKKLSAIRRVDYGRPIDNPTTVRIPWVIHATKPVWYEEHRWDEICIWAIDQFGLPGDRYTTSPTENYMDFHFRNEQDAVFFGLKWSHYD